MKALKTVILFLFLVSLLLLQQCASPGPLGGGPKDIHAPEFLGSNPPKFSRNIKPRKIFLEFDEFLVLKELGENMLISPPLNEDPEIVLRGKRVLIKNHKDIIFDTNSTYTYYFGNAICDLHEENPVENFEYVFSTGSSLDSLSIRGKILNSRYLIPEEKVYVCLYKKFMNDTIPFDSLPYFVRPYYISRTNKLGEYQLNNIRKDEYLLFAVSDMNRNYYFDMPNEKIAFIDSLVLPQEVFEYIPDSIAIDTSDQNLMDSLWKYHSFTMVQNPVDMFLFSEDDSIPKLLETKVTENQRIDFFFKFPIHDSIHITALNDSIKLPWYIEEYSKEKDTLSLWLTRISQDSLYLELKVDTIQADTLGLLVRSVVKEKEEPRRRKKKDKEKDEKKEKEVIKYKSNVKSSLPFFQNVRIKFETPLKYANLDNIVLIEDSLKVLPKAYFLDSIKRNLEIDYEWKQASKYKLVLPQEAFQDIFGLQNDSIILKFTTTSEDNYGNIQIDLEINDSLSYPYIFALIKGEKDKELQIQSHRITSDTLLVIPHISEGDYYLKAFVDYNNNGKWNTGNFGKRMLPEPVYYFQKQFNIKSGWDIQESWKLSEKDRNRPVAPKKENKKDAKK